ncbi:MAG: hypothetical protein ACW964_01530 [Candidatus Hodarchaeales archaeon]|jgi:hypothetical protein
MSSNQLHKIQMDNIQRKIINDFGDIISKETELSITVVKGFLWKALREWQTIHGISIIDTEKGSGSSPGDRIRQAKEILNIFKTLLTESTDIDTKLLDRGISKSIRHYLSNYANR